MSEVISVGCSQFSNHVLAHLYNNQESHVPYKKHQTLLYNNEVFMSQTLVNGKKNYHPRALIYDVRNGYGSLNKHEYYEKAPAGFDSSVQVINTDPRVNKNDYQVGLDKGLNKASSLTIENTKYWTDYNKLIFKPMGLNQLDSWELNPEKPNSDIYNRFTPNLKFINYDVGQEEFNKVEEENLDLFRKYLEDCDFFQGIQLFNQSDNAWSGFTNLWLQNIKDEFFNYTSNNKFNIWVWDFFTSDRKLPAMETLARIKGLVEFHKNCSLVIPLAMSPVETSLSNWENAGIPSILINSVWETISSTDRVTTMTEFELTLLGDDYNRNIVNKASLTSLKDISLDQLSIVDSSGKLECLDLGFNKNKTNYQFSRNHIVHELDKDLYDINNTINDPELTNSRGKVYYSKNDLLDITKIDTFPQHVFQPKKVFLEFAITNSFKDDIKTFIKVVDRFKNVDAIVGDKQELLHDLYNLKRLFSNSPEFEDDSDDDYYYE